MTAHLATEDSCPECGALLIGGVIPEESREHFGGAKNFRREIGIYSRERDRVIAWRCPDCGHEEPW